MVESKAAANLRAEELRQEIARHDRLYYQLAEPEISDREFDALLAELVQIEQRHPALRTADSPTQRVGGEPIDGFEQVEHQPPMQSLDNTYSLEELEEWAARLARLAEAEGIAPTEIRYVAELKVDGVSISLLYQDGMLAQAATRGNGRVGDVVTENARTIRSLPLRLLGDAPLRLLVRGEIYMARPVFDDLNQRRQESAEPLYVNPRNTAAGTIRLLDSREVASRSLSIWTYDLTEPELCASHSESLERLSQFGLPVHASWRRCRTLEQVREFIGQWQQDRSSLDFDIDGVVVKVDSLDQRELFGSTSKAPRWAVAFKYQAEQAVTKVVAINAQVGRTGALTPVAELEPVFVGGTTVQRATLHNYEDLARKDVRVNDWVVIEKGGDIIPKVVEVVLDRRPKASREFEPPQFCPTCGHRVTKLEEEVAWRCVNVACPAVVKESIRHFVARSAMNIEGLGDRLIDQLLSEQLIEDYAGLYSLRFEDLLGLEGWGEKSARKLLDELERSKQQGLASLLAGLGIRFVGERVAKTLADHFESMERLSEASLEELVEVEEVGPKVGASVVAFFADEDNRRRLEALRKAGVAMKVVGAGAGAEQPLAGKRVVLTGALERLTRRQAKARLEALGARVSGSISSRTDFLVAGEKAGSKLDKARDLGVEIVDEVALLTLLAAGEQSPDPG